MHVLTPILTSENVASAPDRLQSVDLEIAHESARKFDGPRHGRNVKQTYRQLKPEPRRIAAEEYLLHSDVWI
jgi:hypothetical protein